MKIKLAALFSTILLLGALFLFFDNKRNWTTRAALKHMKKSQYYQRFHDIADKMDDKIAEIFLEIGNYSWGGYSAVLIIETKKDTKLYSYFFYRKNFSFCEIKIDRKEFTGFFDELVREGIWKIRNSLYNLFLDTIIIHDASTYFLKIEKMGKTNYVTVYAPEVRERAEVHWTLIKNIIEFNKKHIDDKECKAE